MRLRSLASMVLVTICLIMGGCSTRRVSRYDKQADGATSREASHLPLLYLLASPHARLYVEVDAVQGCEPKDVALQQLRDFLSAHCHKPDGIEIVRGDVIPVKSARGVSAYALARKYIDGPDKTNGAPPAFLYCSTTTTR